MSAALLSYTDEGQDWASRCPPIAADALSFLRFATARSAAARAFSVPPLLLAPSCRSKKGLWSAERQAPTKRDCAAFQLLRAAAVGVHKCAQRHGGGTTMLVRTFATDRKSTRLNSSHLGISYAVFCLKKKKTKKD